MKKNSYFSYLVLILIALLFIAPFAIIVICCFSTNASIKGGIYFSNLTLDNFISNLISLQRNELFFRSLINSLIVSLVASLFSCLIASLFGFSFCIKTKGKNQYIGIFLYFLMGLPSVILLIPTFLIYRFLKILDTYFALIISSMNIPFLCSVFKENAEIFPSNLIKTAKTDGANLFTIFIKIYLPHMKYVSITSMLISFFGSWNSTIFPAVIIHSKEKMTNAVYLNAYSSILFGDYATLMLALVVSILPPFIMFLIFHRNLDKIYYVD